MMAGPATSESSIGAAAGPVDLADLRRLGRRLAVPDPSPAVDAAVEAAVDAAVERLR